MAAGLVGAAALALAAGSMGTGYSVADGDAGGHANGRPYATVLRR